MYLFTAHKYQECLGCAEFYLSITFTKDIEVLKIDLLKIYQYVFLNIDI